MTASPWIEVRDYTVGAGWAPAEQKDARARGYCELLESGEILFFREPPFRLPAEDREFLLTQQWTESRLHKNVSYRPGEDILRGVPGDSDAFHRLHAIMRDYSAQVIEFLGVFLSPYAGRWILDFSSFRPLEENGRDLPLHKRNDLLHVDAFRTRPTRGGRILRVFTNLNPANPRVWRTTGPFETLAARHAESAGLRKFADESLLSRTVQVWGARLGVAPPRTPYDRFMLRFHDYLKENAAFQADCPKSHLEFPPLSTWIVFTDGVAHAAMSGQYALEQTFLIPPDALTAPEHSPFRILEKIAGRPLIE